MDKLKKLDLMHEIGTMGWADAISLVPEGLMLELGVYIGTSFRDICRYAYPRIVYGFDWFRGLPTAWNQTGEYAAGDGRDVDLGGQIMFRVPDNGSLIVGLVEDTLPGFLQRNIDPVAFVHFDMDIYPPTKFALSALADRFFTGTILVFDEIDGARWEDSRNKQHERRAFSEFLSESSFDFEILGHRTHGESWVVRLI